MTRILRPIGHSFTDHTRNGLLSRGVVPSDDTVLPIDPEKLPGFLSKDDFQMMRQVISALDKVYKKPLRLRYYDAEAYRRRVRLAHALWQRLELRFSSTEAKERHTLKLLWKHRVFPFAQHEVKEHRPDNDRNYVALINTRETALWPDKTPIKTEDFEGRWHNLDWLGNGTQVEPAKAADAIFRHLFDQEYQIDNRPRRNGRKTGDNPSPVTRKGLIKNRGEGIVLATDDPARPTQKGLDKKAWLATALADEEGLLAKYFSETTVEAIHKELTETLERNECIYAAWFGTQFAEHFKAVAPNLPRQDDGKLTKEVWALHNAVRGYYKTLAKSEGFRRAIKWPDLEGVEQQREQQKLRHMLPSTSRNLIERLGGKARNADVSAYIRLGKMVAHASDGFETWSFGDTSAYDMTDEAERLRFLATSEGQSRIKHLEAFARSWRRATSLSLGTLKALANPQGRFKDDKGHTDLTTKAVAKRAYEGLDSAHYNNQINLLFGKDSIGETGESRASLFWSEDQASRQELQWGLIALATQMRNKTYHFNVRRAILQMFEDGILKEPDRDGKHIAGRGWQHATMNHGTQ
ncbi:MAG: type VI-A CRISPR-associated RNA-guided ribonuclease Cas13a [Pseudomonadota bacterium]